MYAVHPAPSHLMADVHSLKRNLDATEPPTGISSANTPMQNCSSDSMPGSNSLHLGDKPSWNEPYLGVNRPTLVDNCSPLPLSSATSLSSPTPSLSSPNFPSASLSSASSNMSVSSYSSSSYDEDDSEDEIEIITGFVSYRRPVKPLPRRLARKKAPTQGS